MSKKLTQEDLKKAIGEALADQIAELKIPSVRKNFIDEAGGPEAAEGVIKSGLFYAKALGMRTTHGGEVKALTDEMVYTGSDPAGGYVNAPPETMAEILRIEKDTSVVARLANQFNQTRDKVRIPSDSSSLTVDYYGEADPISTTRAAFSMVELELKKGALLVLLTQEMLDGSVVDIVNYLNTRIGEDLGEDLDRRVLGASAATPYDNIAHLAGVNEVSLDPLGADYDSVIDVSASIVARAARRARWFMHRTTFAEFRKAKGTDGQPIFQAPLAGQPGTILGFPVELVEVMPTWSGSGQDDMVALFGDLAYWRVGTRHPLEIGLAREASVTIDGELVSLWERDMLGIRAIVRRSGALTIPASFCRILKG